MPFGVRAASLPWCEREPLARTSRRRPLPPELKSLDANRPTLRDPLLGMSVPHGAGLRREHLDPRPPGKLSSRHQASQSTDGLERSHRDAGEAREGDRVD